MTDLSFGIPKKAVVISWDFNPEIAAIKISKKAEKGKATKISLNAKGAAMLTGEGEDASLEQIALSFDEENKIMRVANIKVESSVKLTKSNPRSFSNSRTYLYICEFLGLDGEEDAIFELVAEEREFPCVVLRPIGAPIDSAGESATEENDTKETAPEESPENLQPVDAAEETEETEETSPEADSPSEEEDGGVDSSDVDSSVTQEDEDDWD